MMINLMVSCFYGIMEVIIIGIAGALIINGLRSSPDNMKILNTLFLRITLPCLVFANMATNFSIEGVASWWVFPLLGIIMFFFGGLIAFGYITLDRSVKNRGIFTASVAFHNSILLPLALAPVLFSSDKLTVFLNYLFLYNIFTIPSFFTIGVWMIYSSTNTKFRVRNLFTPPNIATVLGLLFAVTGWHVFVPSRVMTQLHTLGSLSTPLSVLIVGGAIVSSLSKVNLEDWKEPLKIMMLKSVVFPVLAALFVFFVRPSEFIALFIIIGSVMPMGLTIAIVLPPDESFQKIVAGGLLLTMLISILTIPVFMGIYGVLYG